MAVTVTEEVEYEKNAPVERDGSLSREETDTANACHSFWDGAGREAGAKGT